MLNTNLQGGPLEPMFRLGVCFPLGFVLIAEDRMLSERRFRHAFCDIWGGYQCTLDSLLQKRAELFDTGLLGEPA